MSFCFFATQAQTAKTSSKAKKTTISAKAKADAAAAKLEEEKQQKFEDQRIERMRYDSIRIENDRLADARLDSERVAYKEDKLRILDSTNKESWKAASIQKENDLKAERNSELVNKAANLGPTQGRLVKDINSTYNDKAKLVTSDASLTEEQKTQQLASLNAERREKIKAVVGKARERKIEKERKEFVQKNGADAQTLWIDQTSVATTSKN